LRFAGANRLARPTTVSPTSSASREESLIILFHNSQRGLATHAKVKAVHDPGKNIYARQPPLLPTVTWFVVSAGAGFADRRSYDVPREHIAYMLQLRSAEYRPDATRSPCASKCQDADTKRASLLLIQLAKVLINKGFKQRQNNIRDFQIVVSGFFLHASNVVHA
jgi:hypothetical protein